MLDFPIIDSHFHIWDINELRYPWLDNRDALNKPYLFADYEAATGDIEIEGAVYVEVTSTDYIKEVDWVSAQAKKHEKIKGIISWCQLENEAAIDAELIRLSENPLIKGVRRMLKKEPNTELCLTQSFIDGMRLLPKYNLVYDMAILPSLMDNAFKMMQQCPETKFVLEHCGEPDIKNNGFDFWAEKIGRISELPNAYCKLSGFVTKADPNNWTVDDLRPYMEYAVDKFGFDRIMFGSDWPPVTQVSTLYDWIGIIQKVFKGETQSNMEKLFRLTAKSFFSL